jgi:tetratricopeptide (TPR) repeat protein
MTDAGARVPARKPTASTSVFVATFGAVLVATLLILLLDLALARVDRQESDAHAATEYQEGVALLAAGHPAAAVERFGAAVAIDRQNKDYALALGEAMLAEGRTSDAEATLKALLDRAENDGSVNLAMARTMVRAGRSDEAMAYFHRAIFGRWGDDSTAARSQARFELIGLLAQRGAKPELLAELLPLDATSPDSNALRRRLGHLFLLADSPTRAIGMFRELLRNNDSDGDAYMGLGEAALALGNFRTARADLTQAARLLPGDTVIANRLALADSVLALDPGARGLDGRERLARSRTVLMRTIAMLSTCSGGVPTSKADSARVLSAATPRPSGAEAAADAMVGLAGDVWTRRPRACATTATRDAALVLVLDRLAQ